MVDASIVAGLLSNHTVDMAVDQTVAPSRYDGWFRLGVVPMFDNLVASVRLQRSSETSSGNVQVDALMVRQGILIDTEDAPVKRSANWATSDHWSTFFGTNYIFSDQRLINAVEANITFPLSVPNEGYYAVHVVGHACSDSSTACRSDWNNNDKSRSAAVPLIISHKLGQSTVWMNQQRFGGAWFFAGSFLLDADSTLLMTTKDAARGFVTADALWLLGQEIRDSEDRAGVTVTGTWYESSSVDGYSGLHYLHNGATEPGVKQVEYHFDISTPAMYEVLAIHVAGPNRDTKVPHNVTTGAITELTFVDQTRNGIIWLSLGYWLCKDRIDVTIATWGTVATVIADAVKVVRQDAFTVHMDPKFGTIGEWVKSSNIDGFLGYWYYYAVPQAIAQADIPVPRFEGAGFFDVYVTYTSNNNREEVTKYSLHDVAWSTVGATVNQRENGGRWVYVGSGLFAMSTGFLRVAADADHKGHVIADAFHFVLARTTYIQVLDTDHDSDKVILRGDWRESTHFSHYAGLHYIHDNNVDKGKKSVTYLFFAPVPGSYELYEIHAPSLTGRNTNVPLTVTQGTTTLARVTINQQQGSADKFNALTLLENVAVGQVSVLLSTDRTTATVVADAFAFVLVQEKCDADKHFQVFEGPGKIPRCQPLTTCDAIGQEEAVRPSSSSDRQCRFCEQGKFKDTPNDDMCQLATICPAGYELRVEATSTSDRTCQLCQAGSFKALRGQDSMCVLCTSACPAGQYLQPCGAGETGRELDASCVDCLAGSFSDALNGATSCLTHAQNCPDGHYIAQPGTGTSDTQCAQCATCTDGQYVKESCSLTGNVHCTDCIRCTANQYQEGVCNKSSTKAPYCLACHITCASCDGPLATDCRICKVPLKNISHSGAFYCGQQTDCPSSSDGRPQFLDADNTCQPCRADSFCQTCIGAGPADCLSCMDSHVLLASDAVDEGGTCVTHCQSPTYTLNEDGTACLACRQCPSGQARIANCTAETDTMCQTCRADQFISVMAGLEHCTDCRTCAPGTFRESRCTLHQDAECEPCLDGYSNATDQTQCWPTLPCPMGTYISAQHTPTTDRVCTPCQEGYSDVDRNASTACSACAPGSYTPIGSAGVCPACEAGVVDHDLDPSTPCQPCAGGTFQPHSGQLTCDTWRICGAGLQEAVVGTSTTDRFCQPCILGFDWKSTNDTIALCKPVTTCLASEFSLIAPTLTTNRQCVPTFEARLFFRPSSQSVLSSQADEVAGAVASVLSPLVPAENIVSIVYEESSNAIIVRVLSVTSQKAIQTLLQERSLEITLKGGETFQPAESLASAAEDDKQSQSTNTLIIAVIVSCGVGLLIFLALGALLWQRRRIGSRSYPSVSREVVNFENPMYNSTEAMGSADDPHRNDLYAEPLVLFKLCGGVFLTVKMGVRLERLIVGSGM